jgi:hypothetical protein
MTQPEERTRNLYIRFEMRMRLVSISQNLQLNHLWTYRYGWV